MEPQKATRKLAAILAADIAGYSRLMETDEAGTLAQLTVHRKELIDPKIAEHRGRIVKTTGDGILVEFASVVDAVQCGVEVQRAMARRNSDVTKDRRVEFRVGINLGDIIIEGDDIYGDGVNLAVRLEGLAQPGEVCISGTVHEHTQNKLALGFEDLGEQKVKNIEKPVRAYRVRLEAGAAGTVTAAKKTGARRWVIAAAVGVVVIGGAAVWNFYLRAKAPQIEPASLEKFAFPLPKKPSIAVLPFTNLSGDPEQEYFSDGITEDIITDLSKLPNLFVIARNSTFTYKGKPVKVQRVAEELGVRYVLEGSFRKAGQRVRITAQLVDATTGRHLWAERYDRELKDIFALQDEITQKIVTAMEVKLTEGEEARITRRQTNNPEAYQLFLRGRELFRRQTKADTAQARPLLQKAVSLDPNFASGWAMLGATHMLSGRLGWSGDRARDFARAEELAQKALAIDDSNADAYRLLGALSLDKRQYEKAIAYGEKSVALEPNHAFNTALLGLTLLYSGRPGEGLVLVKRAMRLSPYYPPHFLRFLGLAYRSMGKYDEAIAVLKRARARGPSSPFVYILLAMTYAEAGRQEEARAAAKELLKRFPKFSVKRAARAILFKDPAEQERLRDALRKAGLPENPPLPLPKKPSIAVLPFTNMSDDPKQEYFSDGITEDIITDLSKISGLFVISRNSTFTYKGKPVKVQQVGRELGVKYVLEGSVRKAGGKVRITAQLVDAIKGHHLWAERYDRDLKNIFEVQDEITGKIVSALQVKLTLGEKKRRERKHTANVEVYDLYLQGVRLTRQLSLQAILQARQPFEKAIELDPNYAAAHASLAFTYWAEWVHLRSRNPQPLRKAFEVAQKALALDDSLPLAHRVVSSIYLWRKRHDEAIAAARKAINLDPNDAQGYAQLGNILSFSGKPQEGIQLVRKAMRLNPHYPPLYEFHLGQSYRLGGRYEEAIGALKTSIEKLPSFFAAYAELAIAYSELGKLKEAREAGDMVRKLNPQASLANLKRALPYKDQATLERTLNALRKAGLPE